MSNLRARLLSREVLPFWLAILVLAGGVLLSDLALHALHADWVGRYLGIPGTLLILGSFGYSARKRRLLRSGQPARLLRLHEQMAWAGALLVLVHAGIHFNAILAWLAVAAMLVNVGSGLTGKYLISRSGRRLVNARRRMVEQGMPDAEVEEQLYWDSVTFDAVKHWRQVHVPITLAFAALALGHIAAVVLFWGWT